MPRQSRVSVADVVYHVINRANGRAQIFHTDKDYQRFELLLQESKNLTNMRILSYCIMPNHWHLVLYPQTDTDLAEFMGWLTSTHVRQYRTRTSTIGYGHLCQDRYKSFPTESDEYLQTLIRYVEQNPLRAKLVERAEDWKWSSLWRREYGSEKEKKLLSPLPVNLPDNYQQSVNQLLKEERLMTIRNAVNRGTPFGRDVWVEKMIDEHNLEHTVRGRGRPRQN